MLYDNLPFEKYNDFVNQDEKISSEIQKNDMIKIYEIHFQELKEVCKNNEPLNYEFIKLSQFYLVDIFNNCIYKTIANKKDEDINKFNVCHNNCYKLPEIIYKIIWEAIREELMLLIVKTNNLNDLSKYSSSKGRYEDNRYKNKKLKRFDKLRYIYKYYLNYYDISYTANEIRKAFDLSKEIFLKFFLESNDTKLIDQETKRRYYNELNKYWINFANKTYEDALIYFIFEKKLKRINLHTKIFLYNKNIGKEK